MKTISNRIGFMQGRLSPLINGRIQAFPWESWSTEFIIAQQHGFRLMEWTLDQEHLYDNPLLTTLGQEKIRALCAQHGLSIPSLTGDCFMQAPFWKAKGAEQERLKADFKAIARSCAAVGIFMIVVPLVDNGRLDNQVQEEDLIAFLQSQSEFLDKLGLKVVFESDFSPEELARFIKRLDARLFGINYDMGNSAAMGFDPNDEMSAYGERIINVHVKDRVLGGTTVPLGSGHADFNAIFSALARVHYSGNYILQTARAVEGDHAEVLSRYYHMTSNWLSSYGA